MTIFIRLKIMSSIFRLADACDMSSLRIKSLVLTILKEYELLKKESIPIWESHIEIGGVQIDRTKIISMYHDEEKANYCHDRMRAELVPINALLRSESLPIIDFEIKQI